MFYLKEGLINCWQCVRKHQLLVIVLILLQILFLISVAAVGIVYQAKIITNMNTIMEQLETANYNPEELQKGSPFLENMFLVQNSYQSLKQNLIEFSIWAAVLVLVFQGGLWLLSHHVVKKINISELGPMFLKFLIVSISLLGAFLSLAYFLLKDLITAAVDVNFVATITKYLLVIFVIIYYALTVFLSLLNQKSWKDFLQSWWKLAVKNMHKTILIMLINSTLILGIFYLMYRFLSPENILIVILGFLLLTILLALSRIFLITTIYTIKPHHDHLKLYEKNNN